MANAGTIVVGLIANTGKFTKGMRKSREQMEQFSKTFIGQSKSISSVGIQMVSAIATSTVVATTAILGVAKKMHEADIQFAISGDAMVKQSRMVGLYAQQYKELRYAAEQSGASTEKFNTAIFYLMRNVGQGDEVFKKLGFSIDQLKRMSTQELFLEVADAISNVKSQAEQAAIAYKVFGGSAGRALIETLRLGKDGIAGMAEEQRRLSGVITAGQEKEIAGAKASIDRVAEAKRGYEDLRVSNNKAQIESINNWKVSYWQMRQQISNIFAIKGTYTELFEERKRIAEQEAKIASEQEVMRRSAEAQAAKSAAERASLVEAEFRNLGSVMGDLKDEVLLGYDQFDLMLKAADQRVGFTREEYNKAKKYIEEIRRLAEQKAAALAEKVRSPDIGNVAAATAIEVNRSVSISGMSIGGVVDKQELTNRLLQEQNRILTETKSILVMN